MCLKARGIDHVCGVNLDVGLYRRLQRLGIFWPEMANDANEEQRNCKTCFIIPLDQAEVLNGELQEEDWQEPYLRYLLQGLLHADCIQREKLRRYVTRFKVVDEKLFKRSFQGRWMVCAFQLRKLMAFFQTCMRGRR